jgi:hypothetical protein
MNERKTHVYLTDRSESSAYAEALSTLEAQTW